MSKESVREQNEAKTVKQGDRQTDKKGRKKRDAHTSTLLSHRSSPVSSEAAAKTYNLQSSHSRLHPKRRSQAESKQKEKQHKNETEEQRNTRQQQDKTKEAQKAKRSSQQG